MRTVRLSEVPREERGKWVDFLTRGAGRAVAFEQERSGEFAAVVGVVRPGAEPRNAGAKPKARDLVAERAARAQRLVEHSRANAEQLPPFALFCACLGPIQSLAARPKPRGLRWVLARVRNVLDAFEDDAQREDVSITNIFPIFCFDHLFKEFGLVSLVDSTAWDFVLSVHAHRAASREVDAFARFLDEAFDADDLAFYLLARKAARKHEREAAFVSRGHVSTWAHDVSASNPRLAAGLVRAIPPTERFPVPTADVLWFAAAHYHDAKASLVPSPPPPPPPPLPAPHVDAVDAPLSSPPPIENGAVESRLHDMQARIQAEVERAWGSPPASSWS